MTQALGDRAAQVRAHTTALMIVVLLWSTAPGSTQPDTKIDLVVNPWGYLRRALFAWNDHAGLGELQNQAYGYLFPMGPVFGLAELVNMPDWAAQRLWWSVIALVGFWGVHRLVRRISGLSSDLAVLVALLYVVSPRFLSVLSEISVEAWPASVAPWLVLATLPMLDRGASKAALVRGAAFTVLLTISLGGVNATASAAALLLPALWIITARRRDRPGRALAVWAPAVIIGSAWWLVPLLVLARYAYPFLDYIETSRITTAVTSVPNVLRGASHWIAYILDSQGHPIWQGGWVQAQYVTAIVTGCVVAGVGLAGLALAQRTQPSTHLSRFLVLSLGVGVLVMALGHGGVISSPFDQQVREFLDGSGAPLRNVHKFDPLVRLPIAIGFALAVRGLLRHRAPWARPVLALSLVAALVAPTAVWTGRVGDAQAVSAIPADWRTAAGSVDADAAERGGSTLILPSARTSAMTWGTTTDEPLTALASSPIVYRAAAPLGHPGSTRLLDAIDALAADGTSQDSLATVLARMGISRVVVRQDLAEAVRASDPQAVVRTLDRSPGFRRMDSFGEDISLWSVDADPGHTAELLDAASLVTLRGMSSSLLPALGSGLLEPDQGLRVSATAPSARIVTDQPQWRVYNNGLPPALGRGPVLPASDQEPDRIGARDLPPVTPVSDQVVRSWRGVSAVEVSSTAADPFGSTLAGPGVGPAAALDGDPRSAWWSDAEKDSSFTMRWNDPISLGNLRVIVPTEAPLFPVRALDVITTDGDGRESRHRQVAVVSDTVNLDLGDDPVVALRLEFPTGPRSVVRGISEITSDRRDWGSSLLLPGTTDLNKAALLFAPDRLGSVPTVIDRVRLPRITENSRNASWTVTSAARAKVEPHLEARHLPGPPLESVLDGAQISSDHRVDADPRHRPGAALDGDDGTSWLVPAGEPQAVATMSFDEDRHITGVSAAPGAASVRVTVAGRVHRLGASGGELDLVTDRLEISVVRPDDVPRDTVWQVPELTLNGAEPPAGVFRTDCDAAVLDVAGQRRGFRLEASRGDLLNKGSVALVPCTDRPVDVGAGNQSIDLSMADWLAWTSVALAPSGSPAAAVARPAEPVDVQRASATSASLAVHAEHDAVLALRHGFNRGWRATTSDGTVLDAVEMDGWRQGFEVPSGVNGTITVEFTPQKAHTAGLMLGPLAAVLTLLLVWFTRGSGRREGEPEDDRDGPRASGWLPGAIVAILAGGLLGGWVGLAAGALASLVPQRWTPHVVAVTMASAGIVLAWLGVVDRSSIGAVLGQFLAIVSVTVLARSGFAGVPESIRASRRSTTTTTQ